jgi:hypothetical protein
MSDFIGWLTDVFDIEFTIGLVSISLGALAVSAVVVYLGVKLIQRMLGTR